jgi:hypothetical protein
MLLLVYIQEFWDPLITPLSTIPRSIASFTIFPIVRIPTSVSPVDDCEDSRWTCRRDDNVTLVKIAVCQLDGPIIRQKWPPWILVFWAIWYQTPRQPRKPIVEKLDASKRAGLGPVLKDIVLKVLTVNRS